MMLTFREIPRVKMAISIADVSLKKDEEYGKRKEKTEMIKVMKVT
jgi:hypothetical protein